MINSYNVYDLLPEVSEQMNHMLYTLVVICQSNVFIRGMRGRVIVFCPTADNRYIQILTKGVHWAGSS